MENHVSEQVTHVEQLADELQKQDADERWPGLSLPEVKPLLDKLKQQMAAGPILPAMLPARREAAANPQAAPSETAAGKPAEKLADKPAGKAAGDKGGIRRPANKVETVSSDTKSQGNHVEKPPAAPDRPPITWSLGRPFGTQLAEPECRFLASGYLAVPAALAEGGPGRGEFSPHAQGAPGSGADE